VLDVSTVSIDLRGMPEVKKMLASVDDRERQNRERRAVRAASAPLRAGLKDTAASEPTGNVPKSFQRVRTRVSASARRGGEVVAFTKPRSALFNIFEPGAGEHTIAPKGKPLAGYGGGFGFWTQGSRKRSKSFFSRKAVRHPGMTARPILPTAFEGNVAKAEAAAVAVIFGTGGSALGAIE
jgi:hypothetical protein